MAQKEKAKINDWPLSLKRVMYEVKKDGKSVLDQNGNPIIKPIFQMELELLGKKRNFRIVAAREDEIDALKEFYDLQGPDCNELPVKIETTQFRDEISKQIITRYNVLVRLSEHDDIHVLRLKPLPSEASSFNMAIKEKANNWVCPDNIRQVRKQRYEAAQARKQAEVQEPEKGSKKSPKKGDNLPF